MLNELTRAVIGAGHAVSNALGCGFLEKVYENALALELRWSGLEVSQQKAIDVRYKTQVVGEYVADLVVNDALIVELKAVSCVLNLHHAQCLNYLRATSLPLALLLNFGRPRLEVHRVVCHF
jgi:GxxExxY protein